MVDLNKVCWPEKCCFCLPLRKGLLCVGYIKLVVCIVFIVQFTSVCLQMFQRMQDSYEDAVIFLKAVASIVPLLLDFIFTLTSIVAGHKKCVKLFEVYIFYCATMVLVYGLAVVLVCCADKFLILYSILFPYSWYLEGDLYAWIGCGAVVILLQTYLTILVRSQIKHLKAKKEAKLARQRSSTSFRLAKLNIKK